MEEDNKQLAELAAAFTKLKNNILGIETEEEEMEVEDYTFLLTNTILLFPQLLFNNIRYITVII